MKNPRLHFRFLLALFVTFLTLTSPSVAATGSGPEPITTFDVSAATSGGWSGVAASASDAFPGAMSTSDPLLGAKMPTRDDLNALRSIIDKRAPQIEEEVIRWRRHFHQNPELSNREFETAKTVAAYLKELGIEVSTGVAHTGVVGVLKGGRPGPVVGLRADMDALPVTERTPVPFKSTAKGIYDGQEVGVMHACGHDAHVAILMGVAKILSENRRDLPGTVKFIFQPAEEGAPAGEEGGAELMVREGVLKDPDVDAVFGLHISDALPVGMIATRQRSIMASVNNYTIEIKGKQAHGSAPWNGIDPIVTAAQIVNNLQTIVSRNMELTKQAAVVTVGMIESGVRHNIIPESATLKGTIRALDEEMRTTILERFETIVRKTAESNGAEVEISYQHFYPITYNDPDLTDRMMPTFEAVAGAGKVRIMDAVTGAEDFSFFQKEVPGVYFFLGGLPEGRTPAGHHTPDFYVDEGGLTLGVRAMARLVVDYAEVAGR